MNPDKSQYTFLWSNNQYDITLEANLVSLKRFKDNLWNDVHKIIQISRLNKIRTYHSTEDLKRDVEKGRSFLDKAYADKFLKEARESRKRYLEFFKKLKKIDYNKLGNNEIYKIIQEAVDYWCRIITFFRATQQEGTQRLIEELKKSFDDDECAILTRPSKIDIINQEQIDWEKILEKGFSEDEVLKHLEGYPWLVAYHDDFEEAIETLKQRYDFDKKSNRFTDIKKEKEHLKKEQDRILLKNEKLRPLVELFQELAVLRMEIKSCWAGNDFYLIPTFMEIAKRTKENIHDLRKIYLLDDIDDLLAKDKKMPEQKKQKRRQCFVALWKDDQIVYASGEEAESIAKKELKELYEVEEKDEIKGIVANPGKVVGIARILESNNIEQAREFRQRTEKGYILLTQMTQPNIMDIASKAAAIVTDEGGMLSHAAIISRELKIPCIVGTHTATTNFKDGEIIEVDANNGIVRKLNK